MRSVGSAVSREDGELEMEREQPIPGGVSVTTAGSISVWQSPTEASGLVAGQASPLVANREYEVRQLYAAVASLAMGQSGDFDRLIVMFGLRTGFRLTPVEHDHVCSLFQPARPTVDVGVSAGNLTASEAEGYGVEFDGSGFSVSVSCDNTPVPADVEAVPPGGRPMVYSDSISLIGGAAEVSEGAGLTSDAAGFDAAAELSVTPNSAFR